MDTFEKKIIGHVSQTTIYPVKGMQGVELNEIQLKSISVVGDRVRAFFQTDGSDTPNFVDTIKFPGLLKYKPFFPNAENTDLQFKTFINPGDPKNSELWVKTPDGKEYNVDSPELLREISEKSGRNLTIVRMGRGAYHSMPVSLMSMATIKEIEKEVSEPIDPRRFRMNLLIETNSGTPFEEDTWIGKQLIFGEQEDGARLVVVKPDKRCATINMNPETSEHNAKILKAVVQKHEKTLGMYCTIVKEGKIRKNDQIWIKS